MHHPAPNLIIAGAQKSGTTWLHQMLGRHPDIFMSQPKELNFFNSPRAKAGLDPEYLAHFQEGAGRRFRGESTPAYFWRKAQGSPFSPPPGPDAATALARLLGEDAKLIVLLRDPVSRAVSGYHHHFAMGREAGAKGIFQCDPRLGIVDLGFYSRHGRHWNALFGERLRYLCFDDIATRPAALLRELTDWLGLPALPDETLQAYGTRRTNTRRDILVRKKLQAAAEFPPVDRQELAALLSLYRRDVAWSEEALGRQLPHWRDREALEALNAEFLKPPS